MATEQQMNAVAKQIRPTTLRLYNALTHIAQRDGHYPEAGNDYIILPLAFAASVFIGHDELARDPLITKEHPWYAVFAKREQAQARKSINSARHRLFEEVIDSALVDMARLAKRTDEQVITGIERLLPEAMKSDTRPLPPAPDYETARDISAVVGQLYGCTVMAGNWDGAALSYRLTKLAGKFTK